MKLVDPRFDNFVMEIKPKSQTKEYPGEEVAHTLRTLIEKYSQEGK